MLKSVKQHSKFFHANCLFQVEVLFLNSQLPFKSSKHLSLSFMTLSFLIQNLKKNQQHSIFFVYTMFQTCNQEITASLLTLFFAYYDKENKQV